MYYVNRFQGLDWLNKKEVRFWNQINKKLNFLGRDFAPRSMSILEPNSTDMHQIAR